MKYVIYFTSFIRLGLVSHISQTTGQLESIESAEAGAYLISFKSRAAAEQVSLSFSINDFSLLTDSFIFFPDRV